MLRLLALLPLALLPAVVAAPVPPGRVEFGANGLLSRADLEKVTFDTRPATREDGRPFPEDAELERDREKRKEKPDAPQRPNRYDLAAHMPWAKFRAGGSMPVYLVLRNNRDSVLRFGSSIDISGDMPALHGGGMSFDVRDRAAGKSVVRGLSASTNCGGGSLVDVPPEGFFCVKGDLNRITGGPLPPGEYEVDWRCGQFASAPTRFVVLPSDAKPAPIAKRGQLHFYHLRSDGAFEHPEHVGEPILWDEAQMSSVRAESMTAALAVGQGGVYVPDVRAIPTADKLVEAWATWKPYRDGDRVSVTLRAVPPHEKVRFDEVPQLFVQVETPGEQHRLHCAESLKEAKLSARERENLITPLTIEAKLPEDWREWLGGSETARVSVLVVSKEVQFPRGNREEVKKLMLAGVGRARDETLVWSGVVRSDSTELRLPPRPPAR